ncbi:MAG: hypothetical protein ABSA26_04720 [Thermoguttaceae bacterium]|jgi:hypothetical protein
MPSVQTRVSEEAWEQDILKAVATAVHADKTLKIRDVRLQGYEDYEWIFEGGMPLPYGVTVFQDGSWHAGVELYPENPSVSGQDLQSLFAYLVEKGKIKK